MSTMMTEKPTNYDRGKHPNTLKNLSGRVPLHGETKERKTIALTPTAWNLLKCKAKELGMSIPEIVEKLTRENLEDPT